MKHLFYVWIFAIGLMCFGQNVLNKQPYPGYWQQHVETLQRSESKRTSRVQDNVRKANEPGVDMFGNDD